MAAEDCTAGGQDSEPPSSDGLWTGPFYNPDSEYESDCPFNERVGSDCRRICIGGENENERKA